jgi:hypothetical protein
LPVPQFIWYDHHPTSINDILEVEVLFSDNFSYLFKSEEGSIIKSQVTIVFTEVEKLSLQPRGLLHLVHNNFCNWKKN